MIWRSSRKGVSSRRVWADGCGNLGGQAVLLKRGNTRLTQEKSFFYKRGGVLKGRSDLGGRANIEGVFAYYSGIVFLYETFRKSYRRCYKRGRVEPPLHLFSQTGTVSRNRRTLLELGRVKNLTAMRLHSRRFLDCRRASARVMGRKIRDTEGGKKLGYIISTF